MSYIGTKPTVGNFQICDAISVVNGQAAYTMQVGGVNVNPQSANHMIVSLNGTIQKPNSSYTVANSVITFSSNLATGDVIDFIQILGDVLDLGVPSDGTVTTAKLADSSVSLAKLTATGTKDATTFLRGDNTFNAPPLGGITEADQWRLTSDQAGQITTVNAWERNDTTGATYIGTGLTNSSGIFSFASTGKYWISFVGSLLLEGADVNCEFILQITNDNSNYITAATAVAGSQSNPDDVRGSCSNSFLLDVTNTSNVKFKFRTSSFNNGTQLIGSSTYNHTSFTVIRLGDT